MVAYVITSTNFSIISYYNNFCIDNKISTVLHQIISDFKVKIGQNLHTNTEGFYRASQIYGQMCCYLLLCVCSQIAVKCMGKQQLRLRASRSIIGIYKLLGYYGYKISKDNVFESCYTFKGLLQAPCSSIFNRIESHY